jgi:carboxypeptidase family protein
MERNPLMRALLGFVLLLGLAPALHAQRQLHTVRGAVKDTEGAGVANVEILLESPSRSTRTDTTGRFALDSVPEGERRILVRRIGYLALRFTVKVPQAPADTLRVIMVQIPQQLAPIDVQVERKGIYGVVGDTAYHALPGTLVEVLGARIADTTDERGRFAFEALKERQFVLRVSRVGYYGRLITVDYTGKGRDLSVFLTPYSKGTFDWANSPEALVALPDLAVRLAMEPKRYRMTREELDRFGSMALCDIPRIRSQVGADPNIIMRGSTWLRNGNLCAYTADQLDLVEWGGDPCKEAWKSIADVLGLYCGPQRGVRLQASGSGSSRSIATVLPDRRKGYVVLWPR